MYRRHQEEKTNTLAYKFTHPAEFVARVTIPKYGCQAAAVGITELIGLEYFRDFQEKHADATRVH